MLTVDYLDAVKKHRSLPSDYALANLLGVTRQSISGWRSGRSLPDPLFAARIGEELGIDPLLVIADIESEKAIKGHHANIAEGWKKFTQRVGGATKEYRDKTTGAVITGFLVGTMLLAPPPANASSGPPAKTQNISGNPMYIMSTRKRGRDRRKRGVMAAMARTLASFSKHRLN